MLDLYLFKNWFSGCSYSKSRMFVMDCSYSEQEKSMRGKASMLELGSGIARGVKQ